MKIFDLFVFLVLCAVAVSSYDMIVGDTVHRKMVFHQRVKTIAIPLMKRISFVTYKDSEKRLIKGVAVLDNDFSDATANITDGGVGFSHVTIRMKSQRSHPINYQIEVYV